MHTLMFDSDDDFRAFLGTGAKAMRLLELLKRMNPHVDLGKKIQPGTMMLVPKDDGGRSSMAGEGFAAFAGLVQKAVEATAEGLLADYKKKSEERAKILSALSSEPVRTRLAANPESQAQVEAGVKAIKAQQQEAERVRAFASKMARTVERNLYLLGERLG